MRFLIKVSNIYILAKQGLGSKLLGLNNISQAETQTPQNFSRSRKKVAEAYEKPENAEAHTIPLEMTLVSITEVIGHLTFCYLFFKHDSKDNSPSLLSLQLINTLV